MQQKKNMAIVMILLVAVFIVGCLYYGKRSRENELSVIANKEPSTNPPFESTGEDEALATTEDATAVNNEEMIKVHIIGQVVKPGVYELPEESRVIDAVEIAGGATKDADMGINLAKEIEDGEQINIPAIGENIGNEIDQADEFDDDLININTATASELMDLPGIGEVMAQGIIKYRKNNGGFKTKEEIMNVNRIGEKLYEQIEDMITVE